MKSCYDSETWESDDFDPADEGFVRVSSHVKAEKACAVDLLVRRRNGW
jgi:hypothetical protein